MQLKTRESWQAEIENEAQWTQDGPDLEVLLGGAEQHGLKAVGLQQTTQCVTKRVVIVDDGDDGPQMWLSVKRRRSTRASSERADSEVRVVHGAAAH